MRMLSPMLILYSHLFLRPNEMSFCLLHYKRCPSSDYLVDASSGYSPSSWKVRCSLLLLGSKLPALPYVWSDWRCETRLSI